MATRLRVKSLVCRSLLVAGACTAGSNSSSFCQRDDEEKGGARLLTDTSVIKRFLAERLERVREGLPSSHDATPKVWFAVTEGKTYSLHVPLPSRDNCTAPLGHALAALQRSGSDIRLHTADSSVSSTNISFTINKDASVGSVLLNCNAKDALLSLYREEGLLENDVNIICDVYSRSWRKAMQQAPRTHRGPPAISGAPAAATSSRDDPRFALQSLGCTVYGAGDEQQQQEHEEERLDWSCLAGYEATKQRVQDALVLPLRNPAVFEEIVQRTRERPESVRPRAVLFSGPPGCGKTMCARIISQQCSLPLVLVPLESILNKYYGESESRLSKIFDEVNRIQEGAILFIDEVDALGPQRNQVTHEATRRVLSVLLQRLEGFKRSNSILVAATNRPQDLDSALLSRFDLQVDFELPDLKTRAQIIEKYAKQLSSDDRGLLAQASEGFSGRDLRDVAVCAERGWASKIIRGEARRGSDPPVSEYLAAARDRAAAVLTKGQTTERRWMHEA